MPKLWYKQSECSIQDQQHCIHPFIHHSSLLLLSFFRLFCPLFTLFRCEQGQVDKYLSVFLVCDHLCQFVSVYLPKLEWSECDTWHHHLQSHPPSHAYITFSPNPICYLKLSMATSVSYCTSYNLLSCNFHPFVSLVIIFFSI